jgi:hypothetical protein
MSERSHSRALLNYAFILFRGYLEMRYLEISGGKIIRGTRVEKSIPSSLSERPLAAQLLNIQNFSALRNAIELCVRGAENP